MLLHICKWTKRMIHPKGESTCKMLVGWLICLLLPCIFHFMSSTILLVQHLPIAFAWSQAANNMQILPRCNFAPASFSAILGKLEVGPKLRLACRCMLVCRPAVSDWPKPHRKQPRVFLGNCPHWAAELAESRAKAKNSAGRANARLGKQG